MVSASDDDHHGDQPVYVLHDESTNQRFAVRNQPSDIDACVAFSYLRCTLSLMGILMALTDIPRTGLAVNFTVMYYGPYAFPVVHLNRTKCSNTSHSGRRDCHGGDGSVAGYSGDERLQSVDVWSYKFDSLSIPTRALAKHLNVTTYPACLLYSEPCDEKILTPATVFTMLNELLTKIHTQYFDGTTLRSVPVVFKTLSYWADRLHHVLLGTIGYRVDRRLHSVHHFAVAESVRDGGHLGVNVCRRTPRSGSDRHRPAICSVVVAWRCDHPFLSASTQIPVHESIRLRFAALQQQYPDLQLDLTMISSRSVVHSRKIAAMPTVYYASNTLAITTFIRGQKCPIGVPCTVEFLDDYRYERSTVESSSEEMKMVTGCLRAVSQLYVWLRVLLLGFICCQARLAEANHKSKSPAGKLRVVALTVLTIPSHVLIYSSWFPILGYSLAHFIDCAPVHLLSDNFWSTSNGRFSFQFTSFVVAASTQMRNIWIIALFWKCAITLCPNGRQHRFPYWRPRRGLRTFRAVFVGLVSFLTVFSFLRALRFRNTMVLRFDQAPRHAGQMSLHFPPLSSSMSDYGHLLDVKTITIATVLIGATGLLVQTLVRTFTKSPARFFTCHNHYVPLSAGTLYPLSAVNVFWYIRLLPPHASTKAAGSTPWLPSGTVSPTPSPLATCRLNAVVAKNATLQSQHCTVCDFASYPLNWRPTQGCVRHESLFSVGARSVETQSMVRLVNIGMLSDPIVFLRLRVFGIRLYLYRVGGASHSTWASRRVSQGGATGQKIPSETDRNSSFMDLDDAKLPEASSLVLSPVLLTAHTASAYELVGHINSRRVPWTLLVDCG